MNVFNNPYRFTRAPLKWTSYFFRSFKYAYQRATRGYCDYDAWELFSYCTHVISGCLHKLADDHCGHPMGIDDEEWTKLLHETAIHLENSLKENDVFPHPKTDEWCENIKRFSVEQFIQNNNRLVYDGNDELGKAMREEQDELLNLRNAEKDMALDMLKEHWYDLWD